MSVLDVSHFTLAQFGLSDEFCAGAVQCAQLCLVTNEHVPGVELTIGGARAVQASVVFASPGEAAHATWEQERATEDGACCVALLVMKQVFGMARFRRSYRGTGFDFYAGAKSGLLFQDTARVEISGIYRGEEADVAMRVRKKLAQIREVDPHLPGYAVVVEFSRPQAHVERK